MKKKLVKIRWLDTYALPQWSSESEVSDVKPKVCETVGWLYKETESYVTVVGTLTERPDIFEDKYADVNCIPKGVILSNDKLRIAKSRGRTKNG